MSGKEVFDQTEILLGRFDFAAQLAANEAEHRAQMRSVLLSFVEVMDSFDRLLPETGSVEEITPEQARNWLKSCRLIGKQLEQALHAAGVTSVSTLGQLAVPGRHEVIGVREAPCLAEDTIVQEMFRGYEWDGELLRKPRVIVAKGAD